MLIPCYIFVTAASICLCKVMETSQEGPSNRQSSTIFRSSTDILTIYFRGVTDACLSRWCLSYGNRHVAKSHVWFPMDDLVHWVPIHGRVDSRRCMAGLPSDSIRPSRHRVLPEPPGAVGGTYPKENVSEKDGTVDQCARCHGWKPRYNQRDQGDFVIN